MINEIIYFVIALALVLVCIYYTLKLLDQHKMNKLRKKFPEGTETKSKFVSKLNEIPIAEVEKSAENKEDIISKLLD